MEKIGLICGSGGFPFLFAKEAKERGVEVIAIAVKGNTSFRISHYVKKIFWLRLSEFKKISHIFKEEKISKAVMAGQINPRCLFSKKDNFGPELKELLENIRDKKADTIFSAIADKLKDEGIELMSSLSFLSNYVPEKSVLTKREPTKKEWEDIYFGLELAKKIAGLDIGQTVVVKEKAILAVEALEGTDLTIIRGGLLGRRDAVVVKVSKPNQDMRFDVPVIGLRTIRTLIKAKIKCLAIEAGKTLLLDKDKSIRLADKKDISIVAL
jgi:hypothetical protein